MRNLPDLGLDTALLARSLAGIASAFRTKKDRVVLVESAKILEDLCTQQLVTKKYESIYLAMAGMSFDIAGEGPRSRKAYTMMQRTVLPMESIFNNSEYLARTYTKIISDFGLRDLSSLQHETSDFFRVLQRLQSVDQFGLSSDSEDNRIVLLGIVDLLLRYGKAVTGKDSSKFGELAQTIEDLQQIAKESNADPWISMLARLSCMVIGSAMNRSILRLPLSNKVVERLVELKRIELWPTQLEVINGGLLDGKKLLICTNTATGKTFLSSLVASTASRERKVAYVGPTRSLVEEVGDKMKDLLSKTGKTVAVSTREHPESDAILNDADIVVATYEKFGSIVKKNLIDSAAIGSLIVDEVHKMSEDERGIPLEFILTRFKELNGKSPQIVALSGMVNNSDVVGFSDWLGAKYVKKNWRPVDLEETIYCNGVLWKKNGVKTPTHMISAPGNDQMKRIVITARLVQEEMMKDGQCLIISLSRTKVESIAQEICDILRSSETFLPDIGEIRRKDETLRKKLIDEIANTEPELPLYARNLVELVKFGVAYHHAGLPLRYRNVIENGVRNKSIRALVATTTLEAGVNLPVSMVIFPFPQERRGMFKGRLPVASYRNLAGRAGRPDFDSKGTSVLIALTTDEAKQLSSFYFESGEEELKSAMTKFVKSVPQTRYAVQSEILGLLDMTDRSKSDIIEYMKKLWFWKSAEDEYKQKLSERLSWEIMKLHKFDFLDEKGGKLSLKPTGRLATQSMLYPFSIKNLVDNCKKIIDGNFQDDQFDILVLSLAGIPKEMRTYYEIMKDVKILKDAGIVKQTIKQDSSIMEKYDDTELAANFATVLWYWINSYETEKIIELTGLSKTDAAFIEESLREDAYWVLSTVALISENIVRTKASQRKRIRELAKFCKLGCSDPTTVGLMEMGLPHMGRNTAIKLGKFLKTKRKTLSELQKAELEILFPNNITSTDLLYNEIRELLKTSQNSLKR